MSNGRTTPAPRVPRPAPPPVLSRPPTLTIGGRNFSINVSLLTFFLDPSERAFSRRSDIRDRATGGRRGLILLPIAPRLPVPKVPEIPAPRPTPVPTPPPFPRTPPANDPTFGIGKKILLRGNILITGAIILKELLEEFEDEFSRQREAERKADIDRIQEKKALQRRVREIVIPEIVEVPSDVPQIEAPPRPSAPPQEVPIFLPDPVPAPAPRRVPVPVPAPFPTPAPTAPTAPTVRPTLPLVLPFLSPLVSPFFVGSPTTLPRTIPATSPRPTIVGDPGLTPGPTPGLPFGPTVGTIQLPSAGPQLAQAQSQKCEAVQRRRRKKGKCREGFFTETPTETRFITWRSRECDTVGGRKAKRFIRRVI